jgi:hypothetical protein
MSGLAVRESPEIRGLMTNLPLGSDHYFFHATAILGRQLRVKSSDAKPPATGEGRGQRIGFGR